VISARPQSAFESARVLATIACHSTVKLRDKLHQPLVKHESHFLAVCLASLERFYAHLRRSLAREAVASTVLVGEFALYLGESMGLVIHREQYRPR